MKKIFILLYLFLQTSLFSYDVLDNFIDKQMKIEIAFLDENLSLDEKLKIQEQQEKRYKDFFFTYATKKSIHLQEADSHYNSVKRLKLRLKNNKHKGHKTAVMRDEVLLKGYAIRVDIRKLLHEILLKTENSSKEFFENEVNTIIVNHFSQYQPLKTNTYTKAIERNNNTLGIDLSNAIKDVEVLESVINSFTAALVENQLALYRTARIADSKFFSILNTINQSPYSDVINQYLAPLHLDAAKVIVVLLIIILILIVIKILGYMVNYFLHRYQLKDDDIRYIHAHITTLFKILASLVIIHLIIIAFIGIDIMSLNISKIFGILYILLISLISYRIINTIAYLKIERMKKSKILKNEVINLSLKVINGLNILITLIIILKILGVNLTALLSGLGIAGAAVAFAAKDSIANVFGSIAILAGDVFEQGDWIETKDVNGTVVEIGLRASTIRTFDNALISIPNFELSNSGVKNWSRRRIGRRIKMTLTLTYESDFADIKQAIHEIREMLTDHPGIANKATEYRDEYRQSKLVSTEDFQGVKRTSLVYMDTFSNSSIDILVYCFSRTVAWDEWLEVKEDVMFKIADILKKNHLEFAYPTLMLHQAKEDVVKEM